MRGDVCRQKKNRGCGWGKRARVRGREKKGSNLSTPSLSVSPFQLTCGQQVHRPTLHHPLEQGPEQGAPQEVRNVRGLGIRDGDTVRAPAPQPPQLGEPAGGDDGPAGAGRVDELGHARVDGGVQVDGLVVRLGEGERGDEERGMEGQGSRFEAPACVFFLLFFSGRSSDSAHSLTLDRSAYSPLALLPSGRRGGVRAEPWGGRGGAGREACDDRPPAGRQERRARPAWCVRVWCPTLLDSWLARGGESAAPACVCMGLCACVWEGRTRG